MPQLSQIGEIYASQLFWLAIVFALIYFGIGKAMVPKIERTVEDRAARISGDLAAAADARDQARRMGEDYETGLDTARSSAQKTVGLAKDLAASTTELAIKRGDEADSQKIDAATARIAMMREQALGDIEATTVDAVEAIVAKLSGTAIDRSVAEQKVKAELAHG